MLRDPTALSVISTHAPGMHGTEEEKPNCAVIPEDCWFFPYKSYPCIKAHRAREHSADAKQQSAKHWWTFELGWGTGLQQRAISPILIVTTETGFFCKRTQKAGKTMHFMHCSLELNTNARCLLGLSPRQLEKRGGGETDFSKM